MPRTSPSMAPMPVDLPELRLPNGGCDEADESCGVSARSAAEERPSARLEASLLSYVTTPAPEASFVTYRHDPYSDSGRVLYSPAIAPAPPIKADYDEDAAMVAMTLPENTLHWTLWNRVTFVPYPQDEFVAPLSPPPPEVALELPRLFIGQLPYGVTDMQLDWFCFTLAGAPVYYPERIVKREGKAGVRMPTGCAHVFCDVHDVRTLVDRLHKRVLFDDTGVWYAADAAETEVLADYCRAMKADKRRRFPQRPYDSVVVQEATSSYMPTSLFASRRE